SVQPSVSVERASCFGGCPVYRVEVSTEGVVRYEGTRNVAVVGSRTATVSGAAVRQLIDRITRSGFTDLPQEYTARTAACIAHADDAPTVVLTLTTPDRRHTVRHDHGCAGAPTF